LRQSDSWRAEARWGRALENAAVTSAGKSRRAHNGKQICFCGCAIVYDALSELLPHPC
jgi:hypothetical protein